MAFAAQMEVAATEVRERGHERICGAGPSDACQAYDSEHRRDFHLATLSQRVAQFRGNAICSQLREQGCSTTSTAGACGELRRSLRQYEQSITAVTAIVNQSGEEFHFTGCEPGAH
jgi:hypothetical protein